jgi:hypothetical protein
VQILEGDMVSFWLSQNLAVMALILGCLFITIILFLAWLTFKSSFSVFIRSLNNIVPGYFGISSVLFGLLLSFLSQEVWESNRRAYRTVGLEREQILTLRTLAEIDGAPHLELRTSIRKYVQALVEKEWPRMVKGQSSHEASDALDALTRISASVKMESRFERALIETVLRVRSLRQERLAIANTFPDDTKWTAVILLAVMTQIAIASVHLKCAKSQIAAQVIFATAAIIILSLVGTIEGPFTPPNSIVSDRIAEILKLIPAS